MNKNQSRVFIFFLAFVFSNAFSINAVNLVDGPYVFYRNNQVIVKQVKTNTVETKTYATAAAVNLTCYVPNSTDSFTLKLKPQLITETSVYAAPSKFLAVSDIEGEFGAFVMLLKGAGVIDNTYKWKYGNGHLILDGDAFDRGANVTEVLWLLYKLESEAEAAGGKVHLILGNHDVFNLTGNTLYVNTKYPDNAKLMLETMASLYASDTELGRWLRTKNFIETIGKNLFVHGGISTAVERIKKKYNTLNALNDVTRTKIMGQTCSGDCVGMNDGTSGPYWYRGMASTTTPALTQAQVDGILTTFGVDRVIIGHTIANNTEFTLRYNEKVFTIDTWIANNYSASGFIKGLVYNASSGFSTLKAEANQQTSTPFGTAIPTNQAPTCSITQPLNGSSITAPGSITIKANATDTDGTITKVEFFQGTTRLGESTTSPYSFAWTNIAAGTYSLTVKATDNLGAVTTSSAVSVTVNAAGGSLVTISKRISAVLEDVEEASTGGVYTNSTDLELIYDAANSGNQTVGLRFTSLNIPRGVTITKAYIQFTCDEITTGATSATIKGEAVDNSAAFTTVSKNVSSRTKTIASVAWNNIPSWNTVNAATVNERTPELKTIVQEIVNRAGFTTASAISFSITGTGTRTAFAFDGSASKAPLLYIEYTTAPLLVKKATSGITNDEKSTDKKIAFYPNPTSGEINLELNNEKSSISIYDLGGKQLFNLKTSNLTEKINVKNLNNGIYILEIIQNNSRKSFKLVKE